MKKISDILNFQNLPNFENDKKDFDRDVEDVLRVINSESGLNLSKENIVIKKHIIKIRSSSNIRFMILLKLDKIRIGLNTLEKNFIIEL